MTHGWTLIDGAERHRQYPTTFEVPGGEDIRGLVVGDYVKLGFETVHPKPNAPSGERMWVKVTRTEGGFEGTLANEPAFLNDLPHHGMAVTFEARHILAIEIAH